jgi:hypothetical protein
MTEKEIQLLKDVREAICEAQRKYEYCIFDGTDIENLKELINIAFLETFKIDI